jgi:hypothetical protein
VWCRRDVVWAAQVRASSTSRLTVAADRLRRQLAVPASTRFESQLALLVASPVSFVLPSRWQPSSSLWPPSLPSTSLDLDSSSSPSSPLPPGSSTRLDVSRLRLLRLLRLPSTSPSTPRPPSLRQGALWARWDGARRRLACPQGLLGGLLGVVGRGRPSSDVVDVVDVDVGSTLILLPLEPYARGFAVWCVRFAAWVVQGVCTHSLCSRFARLQVVRLDV